MSSDANIVITPEDWGPPFWYSYYVQALALPPKKLTKEQSDAFLQQLQALPHLLPCASCQKHFQAFLDQNPKSEFASGTDAFLYILKAHNAVRMRQHKSKMTPDDVFGFVRAFNDMQHARAGSLVVVIVLVLVVLALCGAYFLYK